MQSVPELTPQELAGELASDTPPILLDVREDDELEISKLSFRHHIPLADLPARLAEIDRSADIVVYCRTGRRSANAAAYMLASGYPKVRNLATGINGWAETVDPSLPQY